ncbi:hypothetical protein KAH94_05455, partial [bacterium]|nr:hypothetical protein [bacterium]
LKKGFAHDFIPLIALIDFLNINPPKKEVLIKKVAMDKEEIDKEFEKYLNTSSVLLKTENIIFKKLKLIKEKDIKEWNKKSSVLRDEKKSPQEIEKVKNKFFNKKKKQYRSFEENIIKKARKTLKEKLKKEGYFVKDKVYRDVEDELWAELIKKFKYRDLVDFFDNKGFLFRFSNEIYSDYGIKFIEKIVLHVKLKDSGEHLFAPGLLKLVVDSNLNFEQAVFIIILFEKDVLQKYKFFQKIVNSDRLQKIYLTLPKKIKKEIEFIFSIVNPFDNLSVFLKIIEDYNQYVKKLYDIEDFNEYITFKSALNFKDPLDLYFDSPDSLLKMWKREFIFNFFEGLRYKDLNKSFFKVRELVKEKDSLVNRLNKIVKKVIKFIENGDIQGVKNFEDKEWDMLSPQNKYGSNNILYSSKSEKYGSFYTKKVQSILKAINFYKNFSFNLNKNNFSKAKSIFDLMKKHDELIFSKILLKKVEEQLTKKEEKYKKEKEERQKEFQKYEEELQKEFQKEKEERQKYKQQNQKWKEEQYDI